MTEVRTNDGARLFVETIGAGEPVLFVHGWSMSGRYFERQRPLAEHHRLIVPDLRAHGRSQSVRYGHRMARYAMDLMDLLDALKIDQVHAVGWSMGASVLLALADLDGTQRFKTLALIDQTPKLLNENGWDKGVFNLTRAALIGQDAAIRGDQAAFLEAFVPQMFASALPAHDKRQLIAEAAACAADTAADILLDHCSQDWRDVAARIEVPTLLMAGANSLSRPGIEYLASTMPRSRVAIAEHSNHCPFLEQPAWFNAQLVQHWQ